MIQKIGKNLFNGWKGIAAMIIPPLNKSKFLEIHLLFMQKTKLTISKKKAAIQKGIATFVKKSNGIPTKVIPMRDNKAIMPKQIL